MNFNCLLCRRYAIVIPIRTCNYFSRNVNCLCLHSLDSDGGIKGLFAGAGPRVARAGPSVGIVVTFYEVVKYALRRRSWSKDRDTL